jgi:chemotaxis protein CheC
VSSSPQLFLTDLEKDALKEIINLSFGDAASSLADIIGTYVLLSVPNVEIMQRDEIMHYIDRELSEPKDLSIVEQYYIGKIKGAAFLVFSHDGSKQLLSLFEGGEKMDTSDYSIDFLEKETLTEVGNIIIGACVSKLAELLSDTVSYLPPRFLWSKNMRSAFSGEIFERESYVILLKTIFQFEEKDVKGFLFLVNSYESVKWLKTAIDEFIEKYV